MPPSDSTDIRAWVIEVVRNLDGAHQALISEMESRQEQLEQQLAFLTEAYAQLAVLVGTFGQTLLKDVDPKVFEENMRSNTAAMVKAFQDGSQQAQASSQRFYPGSAAANGDPSPEASVPDSDEQS